MDMACSKQLGTGYRVAESDKHSLPFKYFCPLCKNLLREPLQTTCGHFYCRSCYNSSRDPVTDSFVCLLDQVTLTSAEVYPDAFVKREILSLTVGCPNECGWSGEVGDLEAHFSKCHKALVQCPNTRYRGKIKSCDLPQLLEEECSFGQQPRGVRTLEPAQNRSEEQRLTNLKKRVAALGGEQDHVVAEAQEAVRQIEKGIEVHQNPGTEEAEQYCPFKCFGCEKTEAMDRQTLLKHVQLNNVAHTLHILLRLDIVKRDQVPVDDLRKQLEELKRKNEALTLQLESAQETNWWLQRKVESQEHRLTLHDVQLAHHAEFIRQLEASSCDGTYLWKIDKFRQRRNKAVSGRQTSFYSPCFYTIRHGYKMCARVFLNGDGIGQDTHISVSFMVIPGEYDKLLRWPFRQRVTIMLLDQSDKREHVVDTVGHEPMERNVPFGCPQLLPLSQLNNHAYVVDNTIFLKVIVDSF